MEEQASPEWIGCKLVNPLCPDDLCTLRENHSGTKRRWHRLQSDGINEGFVVSKAMFLSKISKTREDLIAEGKTASQS